MLDHAEGRGFCAGGDVQLVRNSALEDGGKAGRAFFFAEYRLNHLMFTYPKPIDRLHGRRDDGRRGRHFASRRNSAWRPRTRCSPCPKARSACSPTSARAGTCRDSRVGRRIPRADRRAARRGRVPLGRPCHALPAERQAGRSQGAMIAEPGETSRDPRRSVGRPRPKRASPAMPSGSTACSPPTAWRRSSPRSKPTDRDWAAKELKAVAAKCPATSKVALRQFAEGARPARLRRRDGAANTASPRA